MKRIALFALLFLVFLVWTFPHQLLVERLLKDRLTELALDVKLGDVSPSWPPGYKIHKLVLSRGEYAIDIDSLQLDLYLGGGVSFDADACGGTLRGNLKMEPSDPEALATKGEGKRLEFFFDDVNPSDCLTLDELELGGRFSGVLRMSGLGHGPEGGALGTVTRDGELTFDAREGTISGNLPAFVATNTRSRPPQGGVPIGQWLFERASIEAHVAGDDVLVDDASLRAEGVMWELTKGRLTPAGGSRVRLAGDFRARRIDDSTRSKAIIAILPKATEGDEGWHRYRVSGTLDSPEIIGLK